MNDGDLMGSLLGGGLTLVCSLGVALISVAVPIAIVVFIFRSMGQKRAAAQQLIATGAPGQARVLSIGQTGMYVNNQPQVQIDLEVHPVPEAGGFRGPNAPFRAVLRTIVPMMAMHAVAPGAALVVKFDPAAPQQRIEIDWNAMGYAGAPTVSPF